MIIRFWKFSGLMVLFLSMLCLAYSWGYKEGVLSGLSREYTLDFSEISLELKLLDLLYQNENQRVINALSKVISSRFSSLDNNLKLRDDVTVLNIVYSIITNPKYMQAVDSISEEQVISLKNKFTTLTRPSNIPNQ